MRQIKFRVWDKVNKIFLVRRQIEVGDSKIWVYSLPPAQSRDDGENTIEWCIENEEGFAVIEYIGLQDKNDEDIYEGYLIKDMRGDIREVFFGEGGFHLRYPDGSRYMPAKEYREIKGNIYERSKI